MIKIQEISHESDYRRLNEKFNAYFEDIYPLDFQATLSRYRTHRS